MSGVEFEASFTLAVLVIDLPQLVEQVQLLFSQDINEPVFQGLAMFIP